MIPLERFHFLHAWLVAEFHQRRRSMAKKKRKYRKLERSLPVMRPNAGGIDIGATEIFVAVPADRDTESVRSFPTFTQDLLLWRTGCSNVVWTGWLWNPPECTGYRCFRFWKRGVLKFIWSMLNMCITFPAASRTCSIVSGFSICIRWACCGPRFAPNTPYAKFAP